MNEFTKEWFSWFEEGIKSLDEEQVSIFFSKCAKNCVNRGVLSMYRDFYSECGNDLDIFFESLSEKVMEMVMLLNHKIRMNWHFQSVHVN